MLPGQSCGKAGKATACSTSTLCKCQPLSPTSCSAPVAALFSIQLLLHLGKQQRTARELGSLYPCGRPQRTFWFLASNWPSLSHYESSKSLTNINEKLLFKKATIVSVSSSSCASWHAWHWASHSIATNRKHTRGSYSTEETQADLSEEFFMTVQSEEA